MATKSLYPMGIKYKHHLEHPFFNSVEWSIYIVQLTVWILDIMHYLDTNNVKDSFA